MCGWRRSSLAKCVAMSQRDKPPQEAWGKRTEASRVTSCPSVDETMSDVNKSKLDVMTGVR